MCAQVSSERGGPLVPVYQRHFASDAKVAEHGSHEELYARRGLYFDMLRRESGGGESSDDLAWPGGVSPEAMDQGASQQLEGKVVRAALADGPVERPS